MSSHDISRHLFQPTKRYVGARWQQGRCLLDSDYNEGAALGEEVGRRALLDVIGPSGSPDDGFALDLTVGEEVPIVPVSFDGAPPIDTLAYRLRPGSLYLGGLRFEHGPRDPGAAPPQGDLVTAQRDHLQLSSARAPTPSPGQTHSQLTVLTAEEHVVTAVEDRELLEPALGGVDTSVRVRRTARVEVYDVQGTDCEAAWAGVRGQLEAGGGATFDADSMELVSSARLRIHLVPGEAQDLCAPCDPGATGRYLGADNQAIRVMLVQPPAGGNPGRYAWAFDNAAPLYRVQVRRPGGGGGTATVRMLTPPRDESRWPLSDTVIELLPWGTLLDNGEKTAAPVGAFLRVTEGFDPDSGELTVGLGPAQQAELEGLVDAWDPGHPDFAQLPDAEADDGDYLFMRVWHRLEPSAQDILLSTANGPNEHALLRGLGLRPEFGGTGRPGDWWVVTVRPNTPQQILPWNLTRAGGVPPHGPRRYLAPLTLVQLRPPGPGEHQNTEVVASLTDCRRRFRPLVERLGCCTHTVGDRVHSHGEYTSIQAAIDGLPPEGGRVCVLPGRYEEDVVIDSDDVHLEGCGARSLIAPPSSSATGPVLHVLGDRVTVRDLAVTAHARVGVQVGPSTSDPDVRVDDARLEGLVVESLQRAGEGGQPRATLHAREARRLRVRDCVLTMDGSLSDQASVFLEGRDLELRGCRVESGAASRSWSGVQIAGGSRGVRIEGNRIVGGAGHGVTLGSLRWVARTEGRTYHRGFGAGAGIQNMQDPCDPLQVSVGSIAVGETVYDPLTEGDLFDLRVVDNDIVDMSGNGISVLTTLPLDEAADGGQTDRISVERLHVERNRIVGNASSVGPPTSSGGGGKKGKGSGPQTEMFGQFSVWELPPAGIALADGLDVVIRRNEIRANGASRSSATCGVSIGSGDRLLIEDNRIVGNGRVDHGSVPLVPSSRAAIHVNLAGVRPDADPGAQVGTPLDQALRVRGNVVDHPNGPALTARAAGAVVVEGNQLQSRGNNASAQPSGAAHAVVLVQLSMPWESVGLPAGEPNPKRWRMPPGTEAYLGGEGGEDGGGFGLGDGPDVTGQGGHVIFSDNQVSLSWPDATSESGLASGFSVGICAHDAVTMVGNQLALDVDDPGLAKKKSPDAGLAARPNLTAHAVVVGATANVSSNRVAEGVNDALISLLVLGGLLASASHNVSTHATVVSTPATLRGGAQPPLDAPTVRTDRGNLVLLLPVEATSGQDVVSQATVMGTANQLFALFSTQCLGIQPSGRTFVGDGGFEIFGMIARNG